MGSPESEQPNAYVPPAGLPGMPVGSLVRDGATGREGTLRDVLLYQPAAVRPGPHAARPARRLAFLRPVGGGLEWTTEPDQVVPVGRDHPGEVPDARSPGSANGRAD
ncbi:hypothetical protein [Streptomyces sp. NBRC 110028]|uniref:hypothetical protein n=1 Tax=Streptomyces sp. NBRC 110028 TaxID=1621260 RepID=UPI0006E31A18|nr:hypothetical protein [Streptomyces sp. NBRC 110028]